MQVQGGQPRKISFKAYSFYHYLDLRAAKGSHVTLTLATVIAQNVACFLRYSNWRAASIGIFAGVQIAYFATNAPEIFSYAALLTAYVGVATESYIAIAACANVLALLLLLGVCLHFFRKLKLNVAK